MKNMTWTQQERVQGFTTRGIPSLAQHGGLLYMAWRGERWDQGIYYSAFNVDANAWTQVKNIYGAISRVGPSIAEYRGRLYGGWRGTGLEDVGETGGGQEDEGIYYSSFDDNANTWRQQERVQGSASAMGPSLAEYRGRLYMAWRGVRWGENNDQGIYYSSMQ
jgi:hypothetical protein